jgi:hypothetical protein
MRLYTLFAIPALMTAMLVSACGGGGDSEEDVSARGSAWSPEAVAESQAEVKAQQISSQIGVGPARLAFGILQPDPRDPQSAVLVHDAVASVKLFHLDGDEAIPAGEYDLMPVTLRENTKHQHNDGTQHLHDDPLATVYVANAELDKTEWWGAELSVRIGEEHHEGVKVRFFVQEQTAVPSIGEAVPPSTQPTIRDVPDVAMIDSSVPPRPELHDLTVADAVKNGKPTLIAFATPAFCQTRFCGPVVDAVVVPLHEKYRDRVNFIHIEPYKLEEARKGRLVAIPEMAEWGLPSEPWIFVLDASGKVVAKFEGIMSQEEVEPALQRVLGGQATAR